MAIVLSLQGGMAAGKTTAARYVEKNMPGIYVSYENPFPVLSEIKQRQLDSTTLDGYVAAQRLFINAELERWRGFQHHPLVLQDLGQEEIEFYTLRHPKTMGMNWDIESALSQELTDLRKCQADGILYLDASLENLRRHKEADQTRRRGSFEFSVQHLLSHKREWLAGKGNVTFANTDGFSEEGVGRLVLAWVKSYI